MGGLGVVVRALRRYHRTTASANREEAKSSEKLLDSQTFNVVLRGAAHVKNDFILNQQLQARRRSREGGGGKIDP